MSIFVHWIKSGIKYIKELKIDNGKIDVTYIHNKMTNKRNIHNEIMIVPQCLKKHINNPCNIINTKHTNVDKMKKSKYFYLKLVSQIQEKSYVEHKWTTSMNMDITFKECVFLKKYSI